MKKTILITGAAGFIGSHLTGYYLSRGWRVVGVDNFITGFEGNIRPYRNDPDFEFFKKDISKPFYYKGRVDAVLHFASLASPVDYLNFPIQTLKVGSLGTHNMLGLAKDKKAVFLLASTSEVYGDPLVHPQKETYWGNVNPVGVRGVYDESKRFAESIVLAYHRKHGLQVRIVRIFNTYGPRMRLDDGRVVPNFIAQALMNKPLTVYGKGKQTRSFCYVDDLVDGIDRLLHSKYCLPVNLGNPVERTILEFARVILRMTGSRSRIVYKPLPEDDPKVRQPDITLARKLLKWNPKIPLEEGIARTIEDLKPKCT
jgi:dTDP-glucose 4,6-dehydratase